jgi:hypothetical protein
VGSAAMKDSAVDRARAGVRVQAAWATDKRARLPFEFTLFSKFDSNCRTLKILKGSSRPPKIMVNYGIIYLLKSNNVSHWSNL